MTVNTAVGVAYFSWLLNPRNTSAFSWLSNIAANYDMFEIVSMTARYEQSCSSLRTGTIYLFFDYDVMDNNAAASVEAVSTMAGCKSGPITQNLSCRYDPTMTVLKNHKFYCSGAQTPDRFNTPARLWMFVLSGESVDGTGKIFLDYTVRLHNPEAPTDSAAKTVVSRNKTNSTVNSTASANLGNIVTDVCSTGMDAVHDWWEENNMTEQIVKKVGGIIVATAMKATVGDDVGVYVRKLEGTGVPAVAGSEYGYLAAYGNDCTIAYAGSVCSYFQYLSTDAPYIHCTYQVPATVTWGAGAGVPNELFEPSCFHKKGWRCYEINYNAPVYDAGVASVSTVVRADAWFQRETDNQNPYFYIGWCLMNRNHTTSLVVSWTVDYMQFVPATFSMQASRCLEHMAPRYHSEPLDETLIPGLAPV